MSNSNVILPISVLDLDLYKITMQQAVWKFFPDVTATYKFIHRDKDIFFTRECADTFAASISHFAEITVTKTEIDWLQGACPSLTPSYLDFLQSFRFQPDQVSVSYIPTLGDPEKGRIEIQVSGLWAETILWEIPLMACLSETYFSTVDRDWDYEGQEDLAYEKAKVLLEANVSFSEFGTRRRRSIQAHEFVLSGILKAANEIPGGNFRGTSNIALAQRYNLQPIGTIAHEWFMGVAALLGYEKANSKALKLWEELYPNGPLIAVTDTFSTNVFLEDLDPDTARRWEGLRQDSGDPFVYAPKAANFYTSLGIGLDSKTLLFTDGLNVTTALRLNTQCNDLGFKCGFGIGTSLTNDFRKASDRNATSRALNIVIKLSSVDGVGCVKISDEPSKNTGKDTDVNRVKDLYNIN